MKLKGIRDESKYTRRNTVTNNNWSAIKRLSLNLNEKAGNEYDIGSFREVY